MTLTTHAIVGGAIVKIIPRHPLLGVLLAFFSHFALDAIPHWEYRLDSYDYNEKNPLESKLHLNKKFFFDLIKIGTDGILGLALTVFIFSPPPFWIALGAASAMLPDFLQFLYLTTRKEPFTSLQRFQHYCHSRKEIKNIFLGVAFQIVIIILAVII